MRHMSCLRHWHSCTFSSLSFYLAFLPPTHSLQQTFLNNNQYLQLEPSSQVSPLPPSFLYMYDTLFSPVRGLSSVQSFSHVWLFATPLIAARQASLSVTNSQSLLKLMSIESEMPSSHLILCRPLLLLPLVPPSIRVFSNESTLRMRWPTFAWGGVSALASVLPMNTQDWSPLGWTGWISLQSKGLSRGFSNTTVQKHQFFGIQLSSQSNSHIHTWPVEKT